MRNISVIAVLLIVVVAMSCGSDKRKPGHVYMPDMMYSRAYETYAPTDNLDSAGIHYTRIPVSGTIKRGELMPFPISKDKEGDTANYHASREVPDPITEMDEAKMKEAERLYLVNCGICHGQKLDGNGPLYNGGNGPFAAAPRNLVADPITVNMPPGQMFYSVTYGKGVMGSYASQLSTEQRWMVINFIKSKQQAGK
jgi:mono/diheme cytochrome c family protein